jgi:hypothetical protein
VSLKIKGSALDSGAYGKRKGGEGETLFLPFLFQSIHEVCPQAGLFCHLKDLLFG